MIVRSKPGICSPANKGPFLQIVNTLLNGLFYGKTSSFLAQPMAVSKHAISMDKTCLYFGEVAMPLSILAYKKTISFSSSMMAPPSFGMQVREQNAIHLMAMMRNG